MKLFHHKPEEETTTTSTPVTTGCVVEPPAEAVTPTEIPAPRWPTVSQWFDSAFAAVDPIHLEEHRDGDVLVIRAELPGIDPVRDIEVTVDHGMLRIRGERRDESRRDDQDGVRREFRYGAFTRVLPLPAGATESDVEARYEDGFLEVRIPVDAETAAAKTVQVTAA
jgi:HSP20 family protein